MELNTKSLVFTKASLKDFNSTAEDNHRMITEVNEMITGGFIKANITREYTLDEISKAHEDILNRKLPSGTTGVVITDIEKDSPVNYLNVNNIIVEAQKKKIKTIGDLQNIVKIALRSKEKTILNIDDLDMGFERFNKMANRSSRPDIYNFLYV